MFLLLHSVGSLLVVSKGCTLATLAADVHRVAEVPALGAVAHVVVVLRGSRRQMRVLVPILILLITTMSTDILNPLCSLVRSARGTLNTVCPTLSLLAGGVTLVTPTAVTVYRAAGGYVIINWGVK